jgi:hypothetical protein
MATYFHILIIVTIVNQTYFFRIENYKTKNNDPKFRNNSRPADRTTRSYKLVRYV